MQITNMRKEIKDINTDSVAIKNTIRGCYKQLDTLKLDNLRETQSIFGKAQTTQGSHNVPHAQNVNILFPGNSVCYVTCQKELNQ